MKTTVVVGLPPTIAATRSAVEGFIESVGNETLEFDVVLVHQGAVTPEFKQFYDTLEGDLRLVTVDAALTGIAALDAGAAIATGDALVFLGAESRPQAGWLGALLGALGSADIACPLLVARDQTLLIGAFDFRRDPTRDLAVVALNAGEPTASLGGLRPCKAGGAGVAMRRTLWQAEGPLDPDLGSPFAYLDFCLRAAAGGASVVTVGGARLQLITAPGTAAETFKWSERFREKWLEDAPCDPVPGTEDGAELSRYFTSIDMAQTDSSLVLQLNLIPDGASVLELGCSAGHMTRVMAARNCRVVSVELDPEAARFAEPFAERLVIGNLESLDFDTVAQGTRFDIVLAGDVLEHLRNPEAVLRKARAVLAPGGRLVGSVPNVAHGSVRLALLIGQWRYRPTGILDATHLRFFTRWSTLQMLRRAGYDLIAMQEVKAHPLSGEIRVLEAGIPREAIALVEADPDAWVYQFVFEATPKR